MLLNNLLLKRRAAATPNLFRPVRCFYQITAPDPFKKPQLTPSSSHRLASRLGSKKASGAATGSSKHTRRQPARNSRSSSNYRKDTTTAAYDKTAGSIAAQPKKNSPEWRALQAERYQRKRQQTGEKGDGDMLGGELTPLFVSSMIFGAAIPQSLAAYVMIWNDPCSDAFI